MRTATADKPRGLVWELFHRLEDSDFADDLALLAHSHSDIQEKTDRVGSTESWAEDSCSKDQGHEGKKQVQTTCDGRRRTTGGSQRLQVPWELHFIRQQHRQRGVYQNWSRSSAFKKLNNIWKSTTLSTKTKLRT